MKNYYYNPKTQDLMIFDTDENEILTLEKIVGIRVITSSELRNPEGDEPVKHWKNSAWDPEEGKAGYKGQRKKRALKKAVGPAKKCGYCHSTEHRGKDCPNKPGGKSKRAARVITCKNCGETGHMTKTCKNPAKVSPPSSPSEKLPDEEIDKIAKEDRKENPLD